MLTMISTRQMDLAATNQEMLFEPASGALAYSRVQDRLRPVFPLISMINVGMMTSLLGINES